VLFVVLRPVNACGMMLHTAARYAENDAT